MSTSGGTGAGAFKVVHGSIVAAALDNIGAVPAVITAAPPFTLGLVPVGVAFAVNPAAETYDFTADPLKVTYDSGATVAVSALTVVAASTVDYRQVPSGLILPIDIGIDDFRVTTVGGANPAHTGPVLAAAVAAGGAGYALGNTGTINGGTTLVHYTVTGVGLGGAVTAFTLAGGGAGYTTTANPRATTNAAPSPGVGVGFTVNITAIDTGNGDLGVNILCAVLAQLF